jgi:hypothetical protein
MSPPRRAATATDVAYPARHIHADDPTGDRDARRAATRGLFTVVGHLLAEITGGRTFNGFLEAAEVKRPPEAAVWAG